MGCTHTTYIKVENILQPDIAVPLLIRLIYDNALSFHSRFLTLPGNFLGCRAIKFSLSIIQVYVSLHCTACQRSPLKRIFMGTL